MMLMGLAAEVCQVRVRLSGACQAVRKVLLHLGPWSASATGPLCFWEGRNPPDAVSKGVLAKLCSGDCVINCESTSLASTEVF